MSDHDRERETTVVHTTTDGGGGGTVIAVILLLAVILFLAWMFGGQLLGGSEKTDVKVDVEAPATGGSGS
jgi:FlaG/FlaF family flagellin (archaellin)